MLSVLIINKCTVLKKKKQRLICTYTVDFEKTEIVGISAGSLIVGVDDQLFQSVRLGEGFVGSTPDVSAHTDLVVAGIWRIGHAAMGSCHHPLIANLKFKRRQLRQHYVPKLLANIYSS